ncbi:MAG TPA: prolyl oligopeptidase family serine peptidase [Thermoanaerobaculia bacterium]|nr:prolyl oligopeptidase family serine peptidase [Thermoanaerobaculia bacterium]
MSSNALASRIVALSLCALSLLAAGPLLAGTEPLELVDLMKLRTLYGPVISDDGAWVAYELRPDRGDGELVVRSAEGRRSYSVARGSGAKVSSDSRWVAALVQPSLEEREAAERANKKKEEGPKTGLALVATADGAVESFERVESFAFSPDGRWLAYHRSREEAEKGEAEPAPEQEAEVEAKPEAPPEIEGVPEPALPPEPPPAEPPAVELSPEPEPETPEEPEVGATGEKEDERLGTPLVLRELATGAELEIPHVESYAWDAGASHFVYAVAAPGGEGNGLFLRRLGAAQGTDGASELALRQDPRGRYTALAWSGEEAEASRLGFVAAVDDEDGDPGDGVLHVWDGELATAFASEAAPEGWFVPSKNELAWSDDGRRLFFGLKPLDEKLPDDEDEEGGGEGDDAAGDDPPFDPYDLEALLEERGVDVWHWDDPLIVPHQKKQWQQEKDRTYRAVYHLGTPGAAGRVVQLADREMRLVEPSDNPAAVLGRADVAYRKEITWDGWSFDLHRVRLADGSRQLVVERLRESQVALSPGGRYLVYWRSPHWYLFDGETGETRNLTAGLAVPFADEDHDYPEPAPGYGTAEWVARAAVAAPTGSPDGGEPAEASAVLVYDKFDLWSIPVDGGEPECLTGGEGRRRRVVFRRVDLDPPGREREFVEPGARLLLTAYDDRLKHRGFAEAQLGEPGVRLLEEGRGRYFSSVARAKEAERLLFSRESYTELPDLWVADFRLEGRRRVSEANPEIDRYGWGEAELVEWRSAAGAPLQGVLIKPAGYDPGERYPLIVYFYRLFSQRLHRFNELAVNHRPSFPHYASHGYAIFLPDIRFEVGRPGHSATQALVSGVQKLVEMGIADPDAVGLHGHSWSGYQAAFVVTQTDLFRAAVAGAPVANMTSAYGGIRYGTGLARMFQYEQAQSRMGVSLWQGRDRYIESSPLFYADRVATPLLIQFGDEDEAVPWTQGIELYLALRRLGKPAWLLQYRGEGHHLAKYPNKLDYSIKMREFFDHYLKGAPAPAWMTEGVPYRGE